ncbi:hypothetical protein PanWU01x14_338690 [Parasponia andersonii]|uniref:Uncharacterized protein n=1 Tax=Parasponia andersonii TaxID=3476 RepID=A0A2P5AF13_PARAD|nr:hypothetical protein PanWU01x14_338690 [Parasponia andersonii]
MVGTILKACSPNLEAWVCLPFSGLVASSYGWILPVFMNAVLGRIFENAHVPVLEVEASCFEVGPWSGAGLFILCEAKVCVSIAIIVAEALGVFWRLSSTLNTLSDFAWTSTILYGTFKRKWSDSIDPGCRPLTNEPAAWTESALCTRDITSRKHNKYSLRDSIAACSNRSRSRMVFCCLRAPAYCFKKRLQKSSNLFMDFSRSCLNHNRAGPARVVETTLQPEGQSCEVSRLGLHLDPVGIATSSSIVDSDPSDSSSICFMYAGRRSFDCYLSPVEALELASAPFKAVPSLDRHLKTWWRVEGGGDPMHVMDPSSPHDDVDGGLAVDDDEVHIQASLRSVDL